MKIRDSYQQQVCQDEILVIGGVSKTHKFESGMHF